MEEAEKRQAQVEERLEKLAPEKGMPRGRWRSVGTTKVDRSEFGVFEDLATGDLYMTGPTGKLFQMSEPKAEGKQPKDKDDPDK